MKTGWPLLALLLLARPTIAACGPPPHYGSKQCADMRTQYLLLKGQKGDVTFVRNAQDQATALPRQHPTCFKSFRDPTTRKLVR